ncbi:hypothetical protein E2562_004927 [Oryza meyeriana var. granulata]|uniref:Uncharacterized protein n=1 Tax=Oryza meyeriana var. granulata TaxID=110450 RepID=A0A6G1C4N6_9ORYZ|nr:hypothetical protein E2562_004927 [Oryza meyeriana var. granulata]
MAGERAKMLKRCVVALLPAVEEEEGVAGEKISLMPCTAHGKNSGAAAAAAEAPLEHSASEERRRSSKRKARRASKPAGGTLVPADGAEMILVPRGKLALSKKLVDKILSLERRTLPHVDDLLEDDDPNPSEAELALRDVVFMCHDRFPVYPYYWS